MSDEPRRDVIARVLTVVGVCLLAVGVLVLVVAAVLHYQSAIVPG